MNALERARRCADAMSAKDAASRALGITIDIPEAGSAVARMRVREDMVNGFGVCHGGFIFALADTAFAFACNAYDRVAVAASANIDFLRPARLGDELTATAKERHAGRRGGVYSVRVTNAGGDSVALFRGRSAASGNALLTD